MAATGYLDACGFNPASGGTGDFVVSAAITGYRTPASAGAVNSTVYSYRAQSTDLSQWENGFGAYATGTTTLARTTVTASSTGSKVSFTAPPNVYITALSADLKNASLLSGGTVPAAQLPASSTSAQGAVQLATTSDQNTGTSTSLAVTPGVQKDHPTAAKAWAYVTVSGTTPTVSFGFNVSSVTRISGGQYTITFSTALPSANNNGVGIVLNAGDAYTLTVERDVTAPTTTTYTVVIKTSSSGAVADRSFGIVIYGTT